jgi:hypothetical protein
MYLESGRARPGVQEDWLQAHTLETSSEGPLPRWGGAQSEGDCALLKGWTGGLLRAGSLFGDLSI